MVYLDYASTAPEVKYPQSTYEKIYGPFKNPNANYAYKEKKLLKVFEDRVKEAIGAKGGKVIFGGTSSQLIENLVTSIRLKADMDNRIDYQFYYSRYEHDSVERFNDWGSFYVDSLADIEQEAEECDKERVTPFVFWQATQNITGEIFPVKQIGELIREYKGFYICDGTAQIGHTIIDYNIDDWCDFWCCSGHKIATELGIGCCWVSDRLDKWLNGFKLHGTPNVAGALAITNAIEDACDSYELNERIIHFNEMQDCLIDCFVRAGIDFQLVPEDDTYPSGHEFTSAINAIRLPGIQADAIQQYLASKQIYIGVGHSSCSNDTRVLEACGLNTKEAHEVIRISFGNDNCFEDVKALVQGIVDFRKEYT